MLAPRYAAVLTVLTLAATALGAERDMARVLEEALRGTQAAAVVLDMQTGAVVSAVGKQQQGEPGSTLKPILLEFALDHGIVTPRFTVYCRRDLHVAGRSLQCTHPAAQPIFDAESALAESCNTWFAQMALRFTGPQLEAALNDAHLRHTNMSKASPEQREFAVLGLDGMTVTPLELAQAYRNLLTRISLEGVVFRGLRGSVDYGMANPARVPGMTILGKTGTASDPGEAWTHGWFVGAIPGQFVLVVYVPHGDGGTAARLAQGFFRAETQQERTP